MEKVKAILEDSRYHEYIELNEAYERERVFCRHNRQHLWDVARIGYILYLESPARYQEPLLCEDAKQMIYGAALLHDIGRWCQYKSQEDHALVGERLAKPILLSAGYSQIETDLICYAIKCHRKGADVGLALLLYEADKLSRDCGYCPAISECNKVDEMRSFHQERLY